MPNATIIHGDAQHLPLADNSVDAVVCDPPYELGFMSKKWDSTGVAYDVATWREALRVLKPGGFLLAFGGTRTWHRLACAIEDAGFELRDSLAWMYSQGFPKSLNVSAAIDKAVGAEREVVGSTSAGRSSMGNVSRVEQGYRPNLRSFEGGSLPVTAPATDDARRWQGWGTSLKPSFEPVVVARKPLAAGTVAANVLQWGCGALNIDATRVPSDGSHKVAGTVTKRTTVSGDTRTGKALGMYGAGSSFTPTNHDGGRWPTNVVFSHVGLTDGDGDIIGDACAERCVPHCPVAELDAQSGNVGASAPVRGTEPSLAVEPGTITGARRRVPGAFHGDTGTASRFFPVFRYQAKAPARERPKVNGVSHPTVKPLTLMKWLARLTCPPGGTILDMFAGSGATLEAALLEGFNAIGVERSAEYLPLIRHRIDRATAATQPAADDVAEPTLFDVA